MTPMTEPLTLSDDMPSGWMLRYMREYKGWSQNYLARLIGIDHSYVGRWERGERHASFTMLVKIMQALGLNRQGQKLVIAAWMREQGYAPE